MADKKRNRVTEENLSKWCEDPDRVFEILHQLYMWQIIEQDLKPWIQRGKVFYVLFSSMDALLRMINDEPKPTDKISTEVLMKGEAEKKMTASGLLKGLTSKKWGLLIGYEKDGKEICSGVALYDFPSDKRKLSS